MDMRRKSSPSPLARREGATRPLRPARASSLLPTAAAVAMALAGLACSTATVNAIGPDPVPTAPSPSVSTSSSASTTPYLTPDPHEVEGGLGVVMPMPVR